MLCLLLQSPLCCHCGWTPIFIQGDPTCLRDSGAARHSGRGSDLLEERLPASLTVERGGRTWMQTSSVMGRPCCARLVGAGREPAGAGGGSAHHARAVFASWGGLCEGCCACALVGARLWTDGQASARGGEGKGRSVSGSEGRPGEPGVRLSSLCEVCLLPQFLEKVLVRGSDGLSETDASPHTENRVSTF